MTSGERIDALMAQVEPIISSLRSGETPCPDALTVACQNLVTWAGRFDPERQGPDAPAPSDDEREAARRAIQTLSTLIEAYEGAMSGIQAELRANQTNRRALGGYGCLKSAGSHSQFVNRKI